MQNEEISKYISEERTRGASDKDIRKELLSKGWKEEVVDTTMKMSASSAHAPASLSTEGAFVSVGYLLSGSWKELQTHFMQIASIMSLPVVAYLIGELTRGKGMGMGFIYIIAELVFLALIILASIGLIKQIRANWVHSTEETYRAAMPYFWPMVWVSVLSGLAVMGGMLLLLVPGIILAIMLSFSKVAVVLEEQRGLSALMWSKVLVKGMWWEVFYRLICMGLVLMVVSIVLSIIPLIGGAISLLAVPFSTIYVVRLYDALKTHKEMTPVVVSKEGSGYIVAAMVVGLIAVPLFAVTLGMLALSTVNDPTRSSNPSIDTMHNYAPSNIETGV